MSAADERTIARTVAIVRVRQAAARIEREQAAHAAAPDAASAAPVREAA